MDRSSVWGALLGIVVAACGDDPALRTGEDPASDDCPCRLETQLDNLALCVSPSTAFAPTHVFSSSWSEGDRGPMCEPWRAMQPVPSKPWSGVRISSRCAGGGQLCVTARSGRVSEADESDCILTRRCVTFAYTTPGQVVELAPLGAWVAESSECSLRHEQLGGYLEFAVTSNELGCGAEADRITRVAVCPPRCQAEPDGEGCEVCGGPEIMTWF